MVLYVCKHGRFNFICLYIVWGFFWGGSSFFMLHLLHTSQMSCKKMCLMRNVFVAVA